MARDNRVQTRMEDEPAERVEQYADEHDLTHSEAVRRLVRAGLDAEAGRIEVPDGGQVVDDLDAIRADLKATERANSIQSVGLILAVPFLVLGFTGILGAEATVAFGVPIALILGYSTYLRWNQ